MSLIELGLGYVMLITTTMISSGQIVREAEVNFETLAQCERARITPGAWWTLPHRNLHSETRCVVQGRKA